MDFEIRHILKETPSKDELLAWQRMSGKDKKAFVNTNGKKYKELGLKERIDAMGEEELFGLLASDGMLMKRPLLVGKDFVFIGFKKAEWEARQW